MIKGAAAIAMLLMGMPSLAQPAGEVLWDELRYGMSKADVNALYPNKSTTIIPGCQARVIGSYIQGRLAQVNLASSKSEPAARCAEVIQATLSKKYGPAQTAESYENRKCTPLSGLMPGKFGEQCRSKIEPVIAVQRYAWINDGVQITLTREEVCPCQNGPSPDVWSISYEPVVRSDPAAKL